MNYQVYSLATSPCKPPAVTYLAELKKEKIPTCGWWILRKEGSIYFYCLMWVETGYQWVTPIDWFGAPDKARYVSVFKTIEALKENLFFKDDFWEVIWCPSAVDFANWLAYEWNQE